MSVENKIYKHLSTINNIATHIGYVTSTVTMTQKAAGTDGIKVVAATTSINTTAAGVGNWTTDFKIGMKVRLSSGDNNSTYIIEAVEATKITLETVALSNTNSTGLTVTGNEMKARLYPVTFPANTIPTFPAIIYTRQSGIRQNTLQGYTSHENPHFQFDIYSTDYAVTKTLATALITAMDTATAFSAYAISDIDTYDDEADVYRGTIDFSIWNRE